MSSSEPRIEYIELVDVPLKQRGHRHLSQHATTHTLDGSTSLLDGEPLAGGHASVWGAHSCSLCGAYPGFIYDGTHFVTKTECTLPEGLDITFDLTVTSGKIIIADDLSPVYDAELPDNPCYSSIAGKAAFCADMEALGCAYGPIQSSDPTLFRTGPDTYAIVSVDCDSEPGDEDYYDGEALARISTAVYAYAIADYDDWLRKGGNPHDANDRNTVIDFPNGTYRFQHLSGRPGYDRDAIWPVPLIEATITRIA